MSVGPSNLAFFVNLNSPYLLTMLWIKASFWSFQFSNKNLQANKEGSTKAMKNLKLLVWCLIIRCNTYSYETGSYTKLKPCSHTTKRNDLHTLQRETSITFLLNMKRWRRTVSINLAALPRRTPRASVDFALVIKRTERGHATQLTSTIQPKLQSMVNDLEQCKKDKEPMHNHNKLFELCTNCAQIYNGT